MNDQQLAKAIIDLVRAAGDVERRIFNSDFETLTKGDGSPVTLADRLAEDLITKGLQNLCPDIPVVGEEAVAAGIIPDISGGDFFLVDPLDGTAEFVDRGGEFTVNIALLRNFQPVMGVIYAPIIDKLYHAAEGQAFCNGKKISVRARGDQGLVVVTSKRYGDPADVQKYIENMQIDRLEPCSSSLKFCVIAEGIADLYPRFTPTCEWDTAAGDAILQAAGGEVLDLDGVPLSYGKVAQKFLNPHFVAQSHIL